MLQWSNEIMDKLLHFIKKFIPRKLFKALQPAYHFLFSWLAALLYRFPSEKLIIVGVTGTTGKTTSVYLIAKALQQCGIKAGYTSTAMFNDGRKEWLNDKKMTMIGRFFTQKILRRMVKNGCQLAIVETTSQGIVQYRHRFINYDILVFTGLYEEHIESHGSFANYKQAKGRLFSHLKHGKVKFVNEKYSIIKPSSEIGKTDLKRIKKQIIANGDDEHAAFFLDFWAEEKFVYTNQPKEWDERIKVIKYGNVRMDEPGLVFTCQKEEIRLKLLGLFNAANAMTAVVVGLALDQPLIQIKYGLEAIEGVAGRLEKIDAGQNFTVIVDYAFEPNAVAKLYETVEKLPHERIIHVLGSAGGGRDMARRPKLGRLAAEKADIMIITNEDPYDDDPAIIIDQVALGAESAGKKQGKNLFKIIDRREAIEKALHMAKEHDVVMVTGKGSEQAIAGKNGEKLTWDDRAVVRGILKG